MDNAGKLRRRRPSLRPAIAAAAVFAATLFPSPAVPQTEILPELRPDRPVLTAPLTSRTVQPAGFGTFIVLFESGDDAVSHGYRHLLDDMAARLESLETARVRLRGYAGSAEDARLARRLSLDRAMAVRDRLIEGGLSGARIDLLALGNLTVDGPPDRVDLTVMR